MGDFNINISDALLTTDKTVNEFYNAVLYISFISYIDSTVLNTTNITIQYNNTIKQNHTKSFGT